MVSVIITSYNYAHFLEMSIESALNQKDAEIEVVVIDDGSNDDTNKIIDKYKRKVISHRQENKGLSSARNMGIKISKGDYLIFLDADDYLFPDTISCQLDTLKKHYDYSISVSKSQIFRRTTIRNDPVLDEEWRLFRDDLEVHLLHFNIAPPHAFLLDREVVEKVGGFDITLFACEDHDLWLRAAIAGYKIIVNQRAQVAYRRHPNSMSQNYLKQNLHDAILHERSVSAFMFRKFLTHGRLECGLACIAGCLLTASRLDSLSPDVALRQRMLAFKVVKRLKIENPKPIKKQNIKIYFLARILLTLKESFRHENEWGEALYREMEMWFSEENLNIMSGDQLKDIANDMHARLTV